MKEYYFKVRKRGTRNNATTIYGITDPNAYQKQMKKGGYTVLEYGSLQPNWRQIQHQASCLRMRNGVTVADRAEADRIDASSIDMVCDCTTCGAGCSFAGKSKGIRIIKNCHHHEEKKG
ncbi:MAG: hypothetical protein OEV87_01110 [Phycisphaerae bacterium]|nr:hypothetical protein [Phycisphaerae bacterium]